MLYDLSIAWSSTTPVTELQRTIAFASELGYNVLALDHLLTGAIPSQVVNPIPKELPFALPARVKLLRRCTLVFNDPGGNSRLPAHTAVYDILALRPTNEKAFLAACLTIQEHALISLDLTQRFDFHFRPKPLMAAVNRGVRFEICYAQATLGDAGARRNFISNCMGLFRATRGRGLVLSSGAKSALGLRGAEDVTNLLAVWGLAREKAVEALSSTPRSVVVNEGLKQTSFRGVISLVDGGQALGDDLPEKSIGSEREGPPAGQPKAGKRKREAAFEDTPLHMSKGAARKMRVAAQQHPPKPDVSKQGTD